MKSTLIAIAAGLASPAAVQSLDRLQPSDNGLLAELSHIASSPSLFGQDNSAAASTILAKAKHDDTPKPSSVQSVMSSVAEVWAQDNVTTIADADQDLIGDLPGDILALIDGLLNSGINSGWNNNPPSEHPIYPSNGFGDAPYSVDENKLRAAIHIPASFEYGRNGKRPVVLVPGTAVPAGTSYHFNFAQLGKVYDDADVVWVNIPRNSLSDAQINAEYVAYAVNYICAVSGGAKVAALTWSQGGLDVQWALKYWPSTRSVIEDLVAISPDFHGTVLAGILCPGLLYTTCDPSVIQQNYTSDFISTLRSDGGDSAYVPTTTVYSSYDEIVRPQSGDDASAVLGDARGVGVTNNHVQSICPDQPAGGLYLHEGVLYNPLAWALAVDALNHDGPGKTSRLDLDTLCKQSTPDVLEIDDVLGTEGLLLLALVNILGYLPKATQEPPIMAYAK